MSRSGTGSRATDNRSVMSIKPAQAIALDTRNERLRGTNAASSMGLVAMATTLNNEQGRED